MNVTTILYLTNSELFGRSTASSQYFLQLASYLGIPVIAWNADNSGLERRVSEMNGSLFDAVISTGNVLKVDSFLIIVHNSRTRSVFSSSFFSCFSRCLFKHVFDQKKMHTDYLMFLDYVFTFVKEGKLHLAHPVLENSPKNSYKFSKKILMFFRPYFPCRCCLIVGLYTWNKK